jgi:hypothetical protein
VKTVTKTREELRSSGYHQQLGQKMCAAFIAQQQGITLNTALGKVPEPVGDLWLIVAEFARRGVMDIIDSDSPLQLLRRTTGPVV